MTAIFIGMALISFLFSVYTFFLKGYVDGSEIKNFSQTYKMFIFKLKAGIILTVLFLALAIFI